MLSTKSLTHIAQCYPFPEAIKDLFTEAPATIATAET
jgi:hypothetical protein